MQKIIDAEKSDIYDVLVFVAYALPGLKRQARAAHAKAAFDSQFISRHQAFLDFVLAHYVQDGDEKLDQARLSILLRLTYGAIPDGVDTLGDAGDINRTFLGFQKYRYQDLSEVKRSPCLQVC
jgi:type I restriction enzyme R subunit